MKDFPDESGKMANWRKVSTMPNAEKMLQQLSTKADCYLATNAKDSAKGDIFTALERVNLVDYFRDIFCFQEIGYAKPYQEYFVWILRKLQVQKSEIIMVGDNLEKDIRGAENYGIEAILYNPQNRPIDFHGKKITDLLELLTV